MTPGVVEDDIGVSSLGDPAKRVTTQTQNPSHQKIATGDNLGSAKAGRSPSTTASRVAIMVHKGEPLIS